MANSITFESYLASKILIDLGELFDNYMTDADSDEDFQYWVNSKEALKTMTLEQLVKENLVYVTESELARFIGDYSYQYFLENLSA